MKIEYLKTKDYEIHSFLNNLESQNSEKIIDSILEIIPNNRLIGYAGFKDKKMLKLTMERFIGKELEEKTSGIDKETIKKMFIVSKNTLERLKKYSRNKKYLFIFPCFDKFTIEKMNGVGGFCSWKDVILLFLNPQENWEIFLRDTIAHEFAHAVSPFYRGGDFSVGEGLIFEGLAEHFREAIFGGKPAPYSKALNGEEIKKIFEELKEKLTSKNWDFYMEVFYGTGRYPNWAGYSIGYNLVGKFLSNLKKIDWNDLLRRDPKKILENAKSNF